MNGNTIVDDRYDALFCTNNSTCTGHYAHPDDNAWAEQVVTSIPALGTDSSASSLQPAKTTFSYYRLAKTGTYGGKAFCYPEQNQVEKDCVGDNWLPSGDKDWQDYYHGEYQGFAQVWTVSPANDLTVDYYYSTEGWNTPMSDYQNFLGGMRWPPRTAPCTQATAARSPPPRTSLAQAGARAITRPAQPTIATTPSQPR
jgi:hypothetical protein